MATLVLFVYVCIGGWASFLFLLKRRYSVLRTKGERERTLMLLQRHYSFQGASLDEMYSQVQARLDWWSEKNRRMRRLLFWPTLILSVIGIIRLVVPDETNSIGPISLFVALNVLAVIITFQLLFFYHKIPVIQLKELLRK
jgi:hypothetical protein